MAPVPHCQPVADADGVEDERRPPGGADVAGDQVADGVEVDVAWDDVGVAVDDGDERAADIGVGQISYREKGNGTALVFVHGLGGRILVTARSVRNWFFSSL